MRDLVAENDGEAVRVLRHGKDACVDGDLPTRETEGVHLLRVIDHDEPPLVVGPLGDVGDPHARRLDGLRHGRIRVDAALADDLPEGLRPELVLLLGGDEHQLGAVRVGRGRARRREDEERGELPGHEGRLPGAAPARQLPDPVPGRQPFFSPGSLREASIMSLKPSTERFITRFPFTKKVGVPLTSAARPSAISFWTCCSIVGELKSFSQRATSRPILPAYSFSLSAPSSRAFWNMTSCISQNLPCLPAATAAFAAFMAFGCMVGGRGKFL